MSALTLVFGSGLVIIALAPIQAFFDALGWAWVPFIKDNIGILAYSVGVLVSWGWTRILK
jgi:hypothetical protein